MSKAFGFAALRVGYAVAATERRGLLEERRAPAPITGPAVRIAAAALRDPRLDVESVVVERERVRAALAAAGYDVPPTARNFVCVRTDDAARQRLEAQGSIVRRVQRRLPDHAARAVGERRPPRARSAPSRAGLEGARRP